MTHFNTALASSSLRDIDLLIATDKRTSSQNSSSWGLFECRFYEIHGNFISNGTTSPAAKFVANVNPGAAFHFYSPGVTTCRFSVFLLLKN